MNGAKAPETPSPTLQEKTVTPETLPTVIGADEGYDGLSQVTVNPDAQLKAENIRSGKTVFGVEGSFVGETQYADTLNASEWYHDDDVGYSCILLSNDEYLLTSDIVEDNTGDNTVMEFPGHSKGVRIKRISDDVRHVIRNYFTKDSVNEYTFMTDVVSYYEKKATLHLKVDAGVHTFCTQALSPEHTYDIEYIIQPGFSSLGSLNDTYPRAYDIVDITGDETQSTKTIQRARVTVRYLKNYGYVFDLEIPAFDQDVDLLIRSYSVNATHKYIVPNVLISIVSATLVE